MKYRMSAASASALAIAAALAVSPALAQQAVIDFSICDAGGCSTGSNVPYVGPGSDTALTSSYEGMAQEAQASDFTVSDAYDAHGALFGAAHIPDAPIYPSSSSFDAYDSAFNGLTAGRRTETYATVSGLPANTIRWFDSFTNETGSTITANIGFGGNLGSDSATVIHARGDGYLVTGQNAPGTPSNDPVIAHLYGGNEYAFDDVTVLAEDGKDNVLFIYPVTVAPGETVSVMNLNMLFGAVGRNSDPSGVLYAQDVAEAISQAELFVNDPIFAGLTVEQIETIVNWGRAAPEPEPEDQDAAPDGGNGGGGGIVIDGTMPAAGAAPRLAQNMLGAFGAMIDQTNIPDTSALASAGLVTGALAYEAQTDVEDAPGNAALARAVGEAGGKVATGRAAGTQTYLFGGYTTGHDDFTAGTLDYSGYAIGAGVEFSPTPDIVLGLAGGYAFGSGSMGDVYSDLDSTQYVISPYARWNAPTGTVLDFGLLASQDEIDYSRTAGAGMAFGETDGHSLGARIGVSQPIPTQWATVTPFAKLSYLSSSVNGYEETRAGNADLAVPSYRLETLEAVAGVGLSREWTTAGGTAVKGFVRSGIGGNLLGDDKVETRYTTSPTPYLNVVENGDDVFGLAEAGFSASLSENISISGSYGATFSRSSTQHTILANLTARF